MRCKGQGLGRAAVRRCRQDLGRGTGWEALTRSELAVVRLVAQGATNRDVAAELHLSRHTVDSHLRHSFAKLSVGNRVALTRVVLANEPGPLGGEPLRSGRDAGPRDGR